MVWYNADGTVKTAAPAVDPAVEARKRAALLAMYPDMAAGPQQSTLTPGAIAGSQDELTGWQTQKAMEPPTGLMATDPNVLGAYQKMMTYGNQADMDSASLKRKLVDSLNASKKARTGSILQANTGFSDRGILNSGISLGQDSKINTAYDTADTGLNDNLNTNLSDIARKKLGYFQDYQNAQIGASASQTKAQADAEAARLAAQQQADLIKQQQADLIASLNPVPAADTATYLPPSIYKPPTPIKQIVAKAVSASSKKALPKLVLRGGPQ